MSNKSWEVPPTFQVNLDEPAASRWDHIIPKYLPLLSDLLHYMEEVEQRDFGNVTASALRYTFSCGSRMYMDTELREELQGIASQTAAMGLSFDRLLALNIGYDLLARCTSAVVASTSGPVHLRNMDWDAEVFWPLTINVDFCRQGQVIFTGTTWVGFVGLQTGMRLGSWSVSLNFRQVAGPIATLANLLGAVCSAWPISFLIRKTLEDTDGFDEALHTLQSEYLMAPCYLTMAGSLQGQGVILERKRRGVERCQALDARWAGGAPRIELAPNACVITNLDCCKSAFDFTLGSSDMQWAENDALLLTALERRTTVLGLIAEWLANSTEDGWLDGGFDVLGAAPVCNDQTVYSCVMRPSDSSYTSRVILKWEKYSRAVNEIAWQRFQTTDAYWYTRHMQMISDRGQSWPVVEH